jgi:hypothetical protein
MVRKQLYLEESQDAALKKRARELGVSEAEVVRRALDEVLLETRTRNPRSRKALERFLARADRITERHPVPADFRFDRQALYEEDDRFGRRHDET